MFEYVLLKQSRFDFIERLFYYQPYGKIQKYRSYNRSGVAKTKKDHPFFNKPYSRFIYTLTLKIYRILIIKNPIKIRQICHLGIIYHLSYPISSKPTKIKHSSYFPIQKIKIIFIQIQHQKSIISLIHKHFFDIHFYQIIKTTYLSFNTVLTNHDHHTNPSHIPDSQTKSHEINSYYE